MPDYKFNAANGVITFSSDTKIEFKVGESKLVLDVEGVKIHAPTIEEKAETSHLINAVQAEYKVPAFFSFESLQVDYKT